MANIESGSIRIGPISILSTVIIICLACLATLSITTSLVSQKSANNQADHTASVYANEMAAQSFLADVDDTLAEVKNSGGSYKTAMQRLKNEAPEGCTVTNNELRVAFVNQDTQKLNVTLRINEDFTYTIVQWNTIAQWDESYQSDTQYWSND